jgi:hypothetical protein
MYRNNFGNIGVKEEGKRNEERRCIMGLKSNWKFLLVG